MAEDRSVSGGAPDLAPDLAPDPAPDPPADQPLARAALRRRRLRDSAAALQLAGAALFLSPFVELYRSPGRILGLPAGAVLLFLAWFALIALAAGLARRAGREEGEG